MHPEQDREPVRVLGRPDVARQAVLARRADWCARDRLERIAPLRRGRPERRVGAGRIRDADRPREPLGGRVRNPQECRHRRPD